MEQFKVKIMHYIQGTNRSEIKLYSHVENWVDPNNPVRLIDLVVEKVVCSNPEKFIWKGTSNTGRKSYSPATMLKLFLYGYINKIASSRRLEAETFRNIELMWMLGELHPDHWTINEYRKRNNEQVRFVTIEFRRFLKEEGYITGGKVAVDGSKFKAYAAKDMLSLKNIKKRLEKVNEKLDKYLEEFKQADILDELAEEFDDNFDGAEIDKALITKIANLQEQVAKLEGWKQQMEAAGKKHLAPNDPCAKLMKSRHGNIPAYNGQTIVDVENHMIALAEISTEENDRNELQKDLEHLNDQLGLIPEIAEADTGYENMEDIKKIEDTSKTKCIVPSQRIKRKEDDKKAGIEFTYDKENDEYQCSQGRKLPLIQKNKQKKNGAYYNVYQSKNCNSCQLKAQCNQSKKGRIISRYVHQEWIDEYKKRVKKSKEKIKERKKIVEHPFGTIKWMMGMFHFLLTGKEKVQIELDLYSTAYNLKRLINIDTVTELLTKVGKYNWARA